MSHKEIMDLMMLRGVEGGTYNKQMTNGLDDREFITTKAN
jgi:hypothetical protein